jgi:hypothetical protein
MKKILSGCFCIIFTQTLFAQIQLDNRLKQKADSIKKAVAGNVKAATQVSSGLSNEEIIAGLKEALSVGTTNSALKLGAENGFFLNPELKINMPEEATKVESTLRKMGMGKMVDKAILTMNRAAEDATAEVKDIFVDAIRNITITDGLTILKGNNTAATAYLKSATTESLKIRMRPVIETSLTKVNATKYWKDVFTSYNQFATKKINPDLVAYVTEKALEGLFATIAEEEQKIRKDPAARVSDLLKKVFNQ